LGVGMHYPVPIHLQKVFAEPGCGRGAFPVADAIAAEQLSLPVCPELTTELVDVVVGGILG